MRKQEKILIFFKNIKLKNKIKKCNKIYIKLRKKKIESFNNNFSSFINAFYFEKLSGNFLNIKLILKNKFKIHNFFVFNIKKQSKKLLLNIYYNNNKILKPTLKYLNKKKSFSLKMNIKFLIFFIKKAILNNNKKYFLYFKIKKFTFNNKKSKFKNYYIYSNVFKFLNFGVFIFEKILKINLGLKCVFNCTHSLRTLKLKKIRRL